MKKSCCKSRMSAKGFTLIEVLVVVLIIAVLAAVAVPQYQKAVLKSRFSSLLPTTKAIRDGNEAYYLTHSGYASAANQLDVTATNNNDMTLELSNDPDYSYVLATRSDLNEKNNLIMYQKHSAQFPGEIHCEALADDTQAEWLCQTGMHATKNLGEVITEGYNTYVLEGTGNGLTPAQMAAAQNAPTCDTAYALGASTCNITTDNQTHHTTKQVCYGIYEEIAHCITTEFDENNKQTKRIVCNEESCGEYEYDSDGNVTKTGDCGRNNETQTSCDEYWTITEYGYDENGNRIWSRACYEGGSVNGKSCATYDEFRKYEREYDPVTRMTTEGTCYHVASVDATCSNYGEISVIGQDALGNRTTVGECSDISGKTCNEYEKYEYEYDSATDTNTQRRCSVSSMGNACNEYNYISTTTHDENGNTIERRCHGEHISGNSCTEYDMIIVTSDAGEGKKITKRCEGYGGGVSGDVCTSYNFAYLGTYDENGQAVGGRPCMEWNSAQTECTRWGGLWEESGG